MSLPEQAVNNIRVIGVGDLTTAVPVHTEVLVLDGFTLVRASDGVVQRLVARDGAVVEAPLSTEERWHAMAMFGR